MAKESKGSKHMLNRMSVVRTEAVIERAFYLVTMAILVLVILLPACAAPQPPVTTPPLTPATPSPAATPPAGTPPATAAPVEIKTSFKAEIYANSAVGFSFMYPEGWIKTQRGSGQVFRATSGSTMAADVISANVIPEATDFGKAVKEAYDNDPGLKARYIQVNVDSVKSTTLADGKTAGNEATISGTTKTGNLYGYVLGTNKGGRTIFITATTPAGEGNRELMREIAQTLTVE
jgi:hypothetical protein